MRILRRWYGHRVVRSTHNLLWQRGQDLLALCRMEACNACGFGDCGADEGGSQRRLACEGGEDALGGGRRLAGLPEEAGTDRGGHCEVGEVRERVLRCVGWRMEW